MDKILIKEVYMPIIYSNWHNYLSSTKTNNKKNI